MRNITRLVGLTAALAASIAFAEPTTFEGTIEKVVPAKKEIYVLTDGKKAELYFSDTTKVTRKGGDGKFDDLKKGQKVKVTADKKGKRLDPLEVEIVE